MEFLQLEYFMDAAVSENFSHTAKKYNVPTSNISQTVKRLESELGVKLFNRTSNKIALSDEGRIFYEGVKKGLIEIEVAKGKISSDKNGLRGEINLLIETNRRLVTDAIEKFRFNFPDVSIIISHKAEPDIKYDIIVSDTLSARGEYSARHLVTEPMRIACLKESFEGYNSLSDFRNERFVSMGRGSRLFEYLNTVCRECGFSPKIAIQTDDPYYVRKYVEMGLGVAIVPSVSWSGQFSDKVKLVDVGPYVRNIYVYSQSTAPSKAAAVRLSEIIVEIFNNESAHIT
ncbi:MAG: LysR family transcriptional regulator [Clostridia bacterium]|nr:LysR family transcriptional regulator [Clostridia bacterium]